MAERRAAMFGTEKDQQNCPFYLKIGACRHGDRCSRLHNKPIVSQTIILPNIYQSPYLKRPAGQPPIPASEEEIQKHFDDFYEDIHEGLSKYGKIELLHVCANLGDHLIGNLYVKYSTEDAAAAAIEGLKGRFYDGRPIVAEFSPVTDFNESRCRQFDLGTCDRGGFCNFMHLHNPSRELSVRLFGERAASRSPSPPRYRRDYRDRGRGNYRRRDYRDDDRRDGDYRGDYRGDYNRDRDRRDYRDDYRDSRDRSRGDYRDRDDYYSRSSDRYPSSEQRESGYKRSRSRSRSRDRPSYDSQENSAGVVNPAAVDSSTTSKPSSAATKDSSNSSSGGNTTNSGSNSGNSNSNSSSGNNSNITLTNSLKDIINPGSTTENNGTSEPVEKKIKLDSSGSSTLPTTEPLLSSESQTIQWASSEERRTDDYDVKASLTKTSSSPPR
ncbi:RNA-binding region RNP-1 domain-containing protein [Heterostelium album PN500]|uniref:RNA-binding region RNP-1 domain-containing protein n=1 Tax=Heterostelium pallidum (strain ATCC 26659 / Pp 5 / PN500) TaxID=670386 RepID=D3BJ52_HETP5|nr:RNA-binding region RNP-1 domain-containing protein [Heterostelium album PN500]EFA77932.1 RNA-binding region RNP-1 domain-containing protein [Heterostelium album PN500]|eukprot:XP_020430060.1 RNA-binding region RNP-1 domain-containing protein [Heterostelium album PN500]